MRTEPCACGGSISAPSLAESRDYIEAHNASRVHKAWRSGHILADLALESVPIGLRDYIDPRSRRSTTDTAFADLSLGSSSASTNGTGGTTW